MKAVVIDDIKDARSGLIKDLQANCPNVKIEGEAEGVVSGAKLIKSANPDLIFLDIRMEDGNGFDLLELIDRENYKVIFTTGADEYAIKAFKYSAIDYLLKPIDVEELVQAVEKASDMNINQLEVFNEHIENTSVKRIALHSLEKIHIIEVDNVIRCESNGNYTLFFLKSGEQILVTRTLKEFDELLSPLDFLRVHQSHLINMNQIKEFNKTDGGYIVTKDGGQIPVSTRKRSVLMERIEKF